MLQRFLFDGKMQQSKISSLSGGERKRLYLLSSLMFGSNFIILDEPTNDLDIKTLEILEDYLDAFRGCLIVVSHDRYFLDRVVDYLFVFEESGIRKFPGNYSDYLLVRRYQQDAAKDEPQPEKQRVKTTTVKLSFNEKRELQQIETQMEALNAEHDTLTQQIETQAATLSHHDFAAISHRQQAIAEELETLELRWLELEEKREMS
jgi:ATP-binding cassette subfamily F protein uup